MTPEPWSTLIPLVTGAALAGVFSLLGGAVQAGREHDRWIRQSRMEAYSEFLVALDAWDSAATTDWARVVVENPDDAPKHRQLIAEAERSFAAAMSRVYLMGPDVVRGAAADSHNLTLERAFAFEQLLSADDLVGLNAGDDLSQAQARSVLLALMNRAIGIGPRSLLTRRFRRIE